MCGIWFSLGIEAEAAATAPLAHRGPDGSGWRRFETPAGPLALGHRRLAVIDTGPGAAQPMSDAAGRLWVSYNGEIYNYVELRRELEAAGFAFRTRSDTEVLLAAYAAWGTDCLSRLTGMFAFALYDTVAGTVLLARDPFGMKPLYYVQAGRTLVAASEIKALLGLPGIERRIEPQRLFEFLRYGRSDHGEDSLIQGIRQVAAGRFLRIDVSGSAPVHAGTYWTPRVPEAAAISRAEAAARLRTLFLDNVRLHLRSDVPVGVLLSGGIDSSSILMAARSIAGPDAALPAVAYMADEAGIAEEKWARHAAAAAESQIHPVRIAPAELLDDIDRFIAAQDEPVASTSVYAQYRVFAASRGLGLKVMLDGQGADEMLAGYPTYLSSRLVSLLSGGQAAAAAALLRRSRKGERLRTALRAGGALLPRGLASLLRPLAGEARVPDWIDRRWAARLDTAATPLPRGRRALTERLAETLSHTSLPALLRYEDRNAMAWSVESRLPFLTTGMAEFVLSLPEAHLIDGQAVTKAVFRDAMRGIVPDAILDRRDKIGFATPQPRWLSALAPWLADTLASRPAREFAALSPDALRRLRDRLASGDAPCEPWVWRCAMAIRWAELAGARL